MIVTIGNTKGGVGKTTLAVHLAIARTLEGRDVLLVDGDRQGTAQMAIQIRAESGLNPGITCSVYPDGPVLRTQVLLQKDKFDDIIIDAGGRDSTALRAALTLSDVLLIPYRPRSFDVWALNDICALINDARSVRDGLRAVAVLNCADTHPSSKDNEEAAAAVADYSQIEYFNKPLHNRKAFADSAGAGKCIFESKPYDHKAIEELKSLITTLF